MRVRCEWWAVKVGDFQDGAGRESAMGKTRRRATNDPRANKASKLYHVTTPEAALNILAHGFRDAEGSYMMAGWFKGVWVSNVPLDFNEGCKGDVVLRLSSSRSDLSKQLRHYEVIEEGKPYREWIVSTRFLNRYFSVRVADWGTISLQKSGLTRSRVMRLAATARRGTARS